MARNKKKINEEVIISGDNVLNEEIIIENEKIDDVIETANTEDIKEDIDNNVIDKNNIDIVNEDKIIKEEVKHNIDENIEVVEKPIENTISSSKKENFNNLNLDEYNVLKKQKFEKKKENKKPIRLDFSTYWNGQIY